MSEGTRSFVETLDPAAAKQANDEDTYKLLYYLNLAHNAGVGQEADVDSFAHNLLEKLGYDSGFRIFLTRQSLPLLICGSNCNARTEVCICDNNDILLLVQKDKCLDNDDVDPEPQLIVDAIAAYQHNNRNRQIDLHLPILEEMVFPASHSLVPFLPSTKSRLLLCSTTPLSPGRTLRRKLLFSGTFLDYLVVTVKE